MGRKLIEAEQILQARLTEHEVKELRTKEVNILAPFSMGVIPFGINFAAFYFFSERITNSTQISTFGLETA
jgi:hypothetical protein